MENKNFNPVESRSGIIKSAEDFESKLAEVVTMEDAKRLYETDIEFSEYPIRNEAVTRIYAKGIEVASTFDELLGWIKPKVENNGSFSKQLWEEGFTKLLSLADYHDFYHIEQLGVMYRYFQTEARLRKTTWDEDNSLSKLYNSSLRKGRGRE